MPHGRRYPYPPEMTDPVRLLLADGRTTAAITAETGFSAKKVNAIRRQIGMPAPAVPKKFDDDEVKELLEQGFGVFAIAEELGCTDRTVYRIRRRLRESGAIDAPEPAHALSKATLDRIRFMLDDGCTVTEICRTLNVGHEVVRRHFPDAPKCTPQQMGELIRMARAFLRIPDRLEHRRAA